MMTTDSKHDVLVEPIQIESESLKNRLYPTPATSVRTGQDPRHTRREAHNIYLEAADCARTAVHAVPSHLAEPEAVQWIGFLAEARTSGESK
jgi:hypothetical protein